MKDILFVGADAGGNVPPMHAVAVESAARGHRIAFAGLAPADPSWRHMPLPAIDDCQPGAAADGPAQLRGMMRMGMSRALGRDVEAVVAAHAPDAVVVDGIMITAIKAAVRLGVPTAVLFHSVGALWGGRSSSASSAALRAFGLSPAVVWGSADARLLLTDRELDPLTDAENKIGFEWTGTTERGVPALPREVDEVPLVLVASAASGRRIRMMCTGGLSPRSPHRRCARS